MAPGEVPTTGLLRVWAGVRETSGVVSTPGPHVYLPTVPRAIMSPDRPIGLFHLIQPQPINDVCSRFFPGVVLEYIWLFGLCLFPLSWIVFLLLFPRVKAYFALGMF